ncbi:hypothetical protein Hanom_Chr15g01337431 [Helianthus anomalus]
MPESSSFEGEIPQFSLPKPPIPPDPCPNPYLQSSDVSNSNLVPKVPSFVQPPHQSEEIKSVPSSGNPSFSSSTPSSASLDDDFVPPMVPNRGSSNQPPPPDSILCVQSTDLASSPEKSALQHPDFGCNRSSSGTIETSIRSPSTFNCPVDAQLNPHDVITSDFDVCKVASSVSANHSATLKPAISSHKKSSRNLRSRNLNSSSGDPELDAIRAENVAHDAKIQRDFDKANGITRSYKPRAKQGGVQIAGFGVVRKQRKSVKYSPMLSDLKVKEFVSNTPVSTNSQKQQVHEENYQGVSGLDIPLSESAAGNSVPILAKNMQHGDVEIVSVHSKDPDEDDSWKWRG